MTKPMAERVLDFVKESKVGCVVTDFSPLNAHRYIKQKFFSFDDFTWSKELSDRWTFLKQNFCHKKQKVAWH